MTSEATAALNLLARMRFACGDNGLRMQDELEEYLRRLAEDAARYRWLRTSADISWNGWLTHSMLVASEADRETLDAAIDKAMREGA